MIRTLLQNRKGLEFKILMTWLFIIIGTIVVIVIISKLSKRNFAVLELLSDLW